MQTNCIYWLTGLVVHPLVQITCANKSVASIASNGTQGVTPTHALLKTKHTKLTALTLLLMAVTAAPAFSQALWTTRHGDIGVAFEGGELEPHWHIEGGTVDGVPRPDEEFDAADLRVQLSDPAIATRQAKLPGQRLGSDRSGCRGDLLADSERSSGGHPLSRFRDRGRICDFGMGHRHHL